MNRSARWAGAVHLVAAALVIVACGSLKGRPAVFGDTMAYVRQGEYLATRMHLARPLADAPGMELTPALSRAAIAEFGPDFTTVAAARSPFYGFALFALAGLGSVWLVALAQALVAAWLLRVAAAFAVSQGKEQAFWITVAVLGAGSSLPFFVDFAMPDVFAGFALVAVALLLVAPDRLRGRDRVGLWVVMSAAMLFHRSVDATVVALTLVGLVGLARGGASAATLAARGAAVAGALALAVLATASVQRAYRLDTGYAQGTPPFLAARLLIDGPGRAYLDAACPDGAAPTFCRYRTGAMANEDDVLWRARGGVFGSAGYRDRASMEREELAFVAASVRFAPLAALRSALGNWALQLLLVFVDDPLTDPASVASHADTDGPVLRYLYPGLDPCRAGDGCRFMSARSFRDVLMAVHVPVVVVSLLVLAVAGRRRLSPRRGDAADEHMRLVTTVGRLVLCGVVLNAAVCGILSGPFARYQARVIWLVPMLAVLGLLAARRHGVARPARGAAPALEGAVPAGAGGPSRLAERPAG